MEHFMPEINWHDREGLLSIDIDENGKEDSYRIVTCSMLKEIRIWELVFEPCYDLRTAQVISTQLAVNFIANIAGDHNHSINCVRFHTFNGERYLASGDSGGRLFVWKLSDQPPGPPQDSDLPPNKEKWVKHKSFSHGKDVTFMAWQPNGPKLASIGRDNRLLIHDVTTGRCLIETDALREFPNGLCWDPLGRCVIVQSTDRKIEIFEATTKSKANGRAKKLGSIYSFDFPALQFSSHCTDAKPTKLFHDDQMMSFKRLPAFSPCGQLVVAPCVHIESRDKNFYGNYVFTRRQFISTGKPSWILPAPKVTFLVKMCPILMELDKNTKENYSGLPHRVIWLTLTDQAVIFYDSQHSGPIAYVDNIHYLKLTDASWSSDGRLVAVSSLEGYCSFLRLSFENWGVKLTTIPAYQATPEKVKKAVKRKRSIKPVEAVPAPPTPKVPKTPKAAKTPSTPSVRQFFVTTPQQQKQPEGGELSSSERPKKRIKPITLD
ncbi:hypothetical protein PFISCL1PPCAC_20369 [Pristionchus fissidentatus]|uniref:CAF1B/HIR1 beta-propeller domain-containing protein n=1 Tax=Pristionchus fissidentatus TaxID=1538716 RepID=A0AAV5WDG7_9BILA|nr:hypothetical protein PFISCL1PPCAC_20369 [Pristionchus fissidentatus]